MRRLNLKLLIILLIPAIATGAFVHYRWAVNKRQTSWHLLRTAQKLRGEGQRHQALRNYGQYLILNPSDEEQLVEAALLAAEQAESEKKNPQAFVSAIRWLNRALRKVPDNIEVRRRLVDAMIRVREFDEAARQILKLQAGGVSDPELDYLYAQCCFKMAKTDEALDRLRKLTGLSENLEEFDDQSATAKDMIKAYSMLAFILRSDRIDNPEAADRVMDQLIAVSENTAKPSLMADAYVARSRYLRQYAAAKQEDGAIRFEAAATDLAKALKVDESNPDVLLDSSVIAVEEKDFDQAIERLEKARKEHPQEVRIYYQLAHTSLLQNQPIAAIDYIKDGLEKIKDNDEARALLVWQLHLAQLQNADAAGMRETIQSMEKLKFHRSLVALAKARVPLAERDWEQAARLLEEVRPDIAQDDQLAYVTELALGECYSRLQRFDLEYEAFQRALSLEPNSTLALQGMATCQLSLGKHEDSLKTFMKLKNLFGDEPFLAYKPLANIYEVLLSELSGKYPANEAYRSELERFREMTAAGDAENNPDAETKLADLWTKARELAKTEEFDKVATIAIRALKENPQEEAFQRVLLRTIGKIKGPKAALDLLARSQNAKRNKWEDTPFLRIDSAGFLVELGGPEAARGLATLENELDKFSQDGQFFVWKTLGHAYYQLIPPQREQARRCWYRAAQMRPGDVDVAGMLFKVSSETGDHAGILELLDNIEKSLGKDDPLWMYFKAGELIWLRKPGDLSAEREASRLVALASKQRPSWDRLLQLEAQIQEQLKNYDEAIEIYQRSLDVGPPNPFTIARLVGLLLGQNRPAEARKFMALLEKSPIRDKLARHDVMISFQQGDEEATLAALATAVPNESIDPNQFVWKGIVLNRINRPDLAQQAFERAVELGPEQPRAWLALIEHFSARSQSGAAERAIRRAVNRVSPNDAPFVQALGYKSLGNNVLAEHYFLSNLARMPDDTQLLRTIAGFYLQSPSMGRDRIAKARKYLVSILEKESQQGRRGGPDAAWARRNLATILAESGSYQELLKAVKLIEENRIDGVLAVEDQRLLAQHLGHRREPALRLRSIDLLEKLQHEDSLTLDDRRLLARLYEANGRWPESRNILFDLAIDQQSNPQMMHFLCMALLRHGEVQRAQEWFDKLSPEAMTTPEANRVRAMLFVSKGEPKQAVGLLTSSLPKKLKPSDVNRVLAVAQFLENMELSEQAEALYGNDLNGAAKSLYLTAAKLSPDARMDLAAFLARNGDIDESFWLCNQVLSERTIHQICGLGLTALSDHSKKTSEVHRRQILDWIEYARSANVPPATVGFLESLYLQYVGAVDSARGKLADLLENDQMQPVARSMVANNLAYLEVVSGKTSDKTLELINSAIDVQGPSPELLDTRALVHYVQGNCAEAVADLKEATAFGQVGGHYYFHLALCYQCAGDPNAARDAMVNAEMKGFKPPLPTDPWQEHYEDLTRYLAESN